MSEVGIHDDDTVAEMDASLRDARSLTQKGEARYIALRDEYLDGLASTFGKVRAEAAHVEGHRENLAALLSLKDRMTNLTAKHKVQAELCMDYITRTRTEQSQRDACSLETLLKTQKSEIDQNLAHLQDLIGNLQAPLKDDRSVSSRRSSTTATTVRARAAAAKAKLEFVKKEAELKMKKAALETDLEILSQEKEAAAAEAEAEMYEQNSVGSVSGAAKPPKVTEDRAQRTAAYVQAHADQTKPNRLSATQLNPGAASFKPSVQSQPRPSAQEMPPAEAVVQEALSLKMSTPPDQLDWTSLFLKKELLLNRLTAFTDKPEAFTIWKETFQTVVRELRLSPSEELDLLSKWLGPESKKQANSIRSSQRNAERALWCTWERLEERYGAPELIEASLKAKLATFSRLTNRDMPKLYDLADLLEEINSTKEDPRYGCMLSYFDTSAGVNPIVAKLPTNLQEKWTMHAVKYNRHHETFFPPFCEFLGFIRELARIKNNPCFSYPEQSHSQTQGKKDRSLGTSQRYVSSCKTDVVATKSKHSREDQGERCPIHGTRHSLVDCRGFRAKPLHDRKLILRKIGACFKCCSPGHLGKDCNVTLRCESCGSDRHHTALHVDCPHGEEAPAAVVKIDDKTQSSDVHSKCTQICSTSHTSRSCAKILPVKVFPSGEPAKMVQIYAIIDDQSNRSLAKTELFNALQIDGEEVEYLLTSCHGRVKTSGRQAQGLVVESMDGTVQHRLPVVIECDDIPNTREEIPTPEIARNHAHLKNIEDFIYPLNPETSILLLLGRDVPQVHHVLDQQTGPGSAPFAQRLSLGWVIVGETCLKGAHPPSVIVNKTHVTNSRPSLLEPCPNIYKIQESAEFQTSNLFQTSKEDDQISLSIEDREFLELMEKEFQHDQDGCWTAPLPFRHNRPRLPNNKEQAVKRAKALSANLRKDPRKKKHMFEFMQNLLDKGHAEDASPLPESAERWYLPIFGVYHPKKPEQIRAVFDSSAKFHGVSLNDVLLHGPDLINSLSGILMRFRQEAVAVIADIQCMFYAFRVQKSHRDYLRFLWHKDNDPEKPLVEYRMMVHVFGNTSSPAVAAYGLRRTAELGEQTFGTDMKRFVNKDFYVDDGLISLPTSREATDLIKRTQAALMEGGRLKLHKIASNSKAVMGSFPADELAKDLRELDFNKHGAPPQRSLGLTWDIETDSFTFQYDSQDKQNTRRSVLSKVNSLFDPLGFLAPVTIEGKLILRDLACTTTDWDEPMTEDQVARWERWKESLQALHNIEIPRAYASSPSSNRRELHVFADASEKAIAAVAYIKTFNPTKISFIMGKAKVAPKHALTMPRLELCAAMLAAEMGKSVQESLSITIDTTKYYSDSRVALGYIKNRTKRFFTYVANRVYQIRRKTEASQWVYVPTNRNPADEGTRGVPADQLPSSSWLQGPDFLLSSSDLEEDIDDYTVSQDDTEVRPEVIIRKTAVTKGRLGVERFTRFSRWMPLIRAIARLTRVAATLAGRKQDDSELNSNDLTDARKLIIQEAQCDSFPEEIAALRSGSSVSSQSPLVKLDPYLDCDGLLRVGGRLRLSKLSSPEKHPLIIGKLQHIATLLVQHYHEETKHQGRHFTEGAIRAAGYWIIGGKRLVSSLIFRCVTCRKLRRKAENQKMADMPLDRLDPGPPFTKVGVDTFGPWQITARRTRGGQAQSKRWAVLFTCLTTRAVHIEVVEELSASSFINALRRFYAIRGIAKVIRSDAGTNFTGAVHLLDRYLAQNGTRWIFNPPHASHFGGVWERMIGTARRIIDAILMKMTGKTLTHEVLTTFLAEVSAIINARPLTAVSTDHENPTLLTPAMLLTQKTGSEQVRTQDLNIDAESDRTLYLALWKKVQSLADAFWRRWRSEYLVTLQRRRKWTDRRRNFQKGDVVLLKDKGSHRNNWPMAIITKVIPSLDDLTRKVEVRDGRRHTFSRPISELVLLVEAC